MTQPYVQYLHIPRIVNSANGTNRQRTTNTFPSGTNTARSVHFGFQLHNSTLYIQQSARGLYYGVWRRLQHAPFRVGSRWSQETEDHSNTREYETDRICSLRSVIALTPGKRLDSSALPTSVLSSTSRHGLRHAAWSNPRIE